MKKIKEISHKLIQKLNYGAFGLHFASAIALIIIFSVIRKEVNFDTNLWTFKLTSISNDDRLIELEAYDYLNVSTIALEVLLILIFLITSLFHIYYAKSKFYVNEVNNGYNRIRWIEYSITSTIMIFLLSILSGVKDFDAVLSLCMINATLMSFGYFFEISKDNMSKILSLAIGFILLIFIWAIIFKNFFTRVQEVENLGRDLPEWIYGVLVPMFFWWCSFGIVAMIQYFKGGDYKKYELCYIILSYLSKAFMGYYLVYGMLREPNNNETT